MNEFLKTLDLMEFQKQKEWVKEQIAILEPSGTTAVRMPEGILLLMEQIEKLVTSHSEVPQKQTPVYVRLKDLTFDQYGDFVKCNFCGEHLLLKHGASHCPRCGSENLSWVDGYHEEMSLSEIADQGFTVVEM